MSIIKFHPGYNQVGTFADAWNALLGEGLPNTRPSVNIVEGDHSYELALAAPGRRKEDFQLTIEEGVLRISSEEKQENKEEKQRYKLREFSLNKFSHSFRLPRNIDTDLVDAKYENGILSITLPKAEDAKPKVLEIA